MAVTKKQADETRWTLGKETDATGSPIQDRTDLVQRSYVATSFAVDENGDKAASDSLRAGFSDTFGELSGLWGDGGITMEVPEGEGLLPIMEGLLGDTAPVSTAQPNKTLVPAATLLTTVTDATTLYFQATGDTTVNVVDAADLNAAITIANNLSEYDTAQALTVTPSADPDNTGADIVINYTDGDGVSQSGTLSFDDDTAQTFDLPANSTITSVTATAADWTSSQTLTITTPILTVTVRSPNFNRPGRLHFVFSAAVPNVETIRVKGLRKVGISTKDWLLMDETVDFGTDVTSDKYFMRILSIELLDADGDTVTATTETLTLTSEPGGYATVVKVADAILPNYTIEAEVADVPRLITGAKFVGGTINNEGTLNVELDVLAERVDRRRTVESGFAEKFTSTMEDNPTEFPEVSIGFFTGVGGYLIIDGDAVLFNSSPITIAHNYESPDEKNGSLFRPEAERTGRRNVTCAVAARYEAGDSTADVYTKWDQKFRDNTAVKARIVQYRWADTGRQKALIWDLPYCEITAPVRVEATAPGSVPITVALKATPLPNSTDTSEIQLTIINDDMA